jgi:hypothetical protein
VPPLGVVPAGCQLRLLHVCSLCVSCGLLREIIDSYETQAFAVSAYLMVLFVLRRIHWGMGRFCF